MSTPHRGLPLAPCAPTPSHLLLDYRFLALWLALSLAPVLAFGQDGTTADHHAIGLRVNASTSSFTSDGFRFLPELTYRYALNERWSLMATLGYWRHTPRSILVAGETFDQRETRLRATVAIQREWRFANPAWGVYGGLAAGVSHRTFTNVITRPGTFEDFTDVDPVVELVAGVRYRLPGAPLEIDVSVAPSYGGRGVGLDFRPTAGLRYRFGD